MRPMAGRGGTIRQFGFGGCLADDMGVGKTAQVLATLEARRTQQLGPSLVVAPSDGDMADAPYSTSSSEDRSVLSSAG